MSGQNIEQPTRPRVLLLGDASARPTGLERALTRAGFQLVEREDPGTYPEADAILVILAELEEQSLAGLLPHGSVSELPPRIVVFSTANPDAAAAALALGAADALSAPVHLPELCARLNARIRDHRPAGLDPESVPEPSPVAEPGLAAESQQTEMLERRVQEEFERARRYSLSFSLVLLGLDQLGSEEAADPDADNLRSEVGRTLRRELRVPDVVVPYGAEEFAILLPETGQSGARQSVIRVRERLTSLPFQGDPRLEPSRFSAGIVTYPHPAALQTDDLFAMAEAALMRGKAQAGERIGIAM